jgi:tripartite-type tricarboxylate transporter receptor subunit TctC
LTILAFIAAAASAQPYPNKPIRIIVPYAPGGGADLVARLVGHGLTEAWGQQAIIDFRGGGGGNLGTELAARATPDGYTLVLASLGYTANPSLYRNLSYDPVKDFAPITQMISQAYVLVVHPSVPAKTVKEFIAYAKTKSGGITYATTGSGQASHLGMELLKTLGGFDGVNVPYKGGAPALIDLIAGQVDTHIATMTSGLPHVKSGKLKGLAVTSLKRSALLPELPTITESAFPGYEVNGWYGLLAPRGTPREHVTRLYQEISRTLKTAEVRERLLANGSEPAGTTPEEFSNYIKSEVIKWEKVIRQSGAKAE